ncbi:hypothetical protein BKA70DRAFT_1232450 [Coprinopsis sp. MPI-PUGE-AT-0042]|nr:hypothetical protein BKA70DRAFT_1232450 [Coprinopsis sp. MPI-PUGE-AT-0042]
MADIGHRDILGSVCDAIATTGTVSDLLAFRLASRAAALSADNGRIAKRVRNVVLQFDGWSEEWDSWVLSLSYRIFARILSTTEGGLPLTLHILRELDNRAIDGTLLENAVSSFAHQGGVTRAFTFFTHFRCLKTVVLAGVLLAPGGVTNTGFRPVVTSLDYDGRPPKAYFDSPDASPDRLVDLFDLSEAQTLTCRSEYLRDIAFLMTKPNVAAHSLECLLVDVTGLYRLSNAHSLSPATRDATPPSALVFNHMPLVRSLAMTLRVEDRYPRFPVFADEEEEDDSMLSADGGPLVAIIKVLEAISTASPLRLSLTFDIAPSLDWSDWQWQALDNALAAFAQGHTNGLDLSLTSAERDSTLAASSGSDSDLNIHPGPTVMDHCLLDTVQCHS